MSKAKRLRQAVLMDRAIMRAVPSMRAAIRAEKNRAIEAAVKSYRQNGRIDERVLWDHRAAIEATIKKHITRMIGRAHNNTIDYLPPVKSAGALQFKRQSLFDDYFSQWLVLEGGRKITDIATTTLNDVRRLMDQAFSSEEPEGVVLRAGLRAKGFSTMRADTIARTELHNAAQFAVKRTAEDYSAVNPLVVLKKAWVPTVDERTRPEHIAMLNSPMIGESEFFMVGGERLEYPGDPSGSAGNVINCRCQLVHEVDFK